MDACETRSREVVNYVAEAVRTTTSSDVAAELGEPELEPVEQLGGRLLGHRRLPVAALGADREHVDRELGAAREGPQLVEPVAERRAAAGGVVVDGGLDVVGEQVGLRHRDDERSEERRVGKGGRGRW